VSLFSTKEVVSSENTIAIKEIAASIPVTAFAAGHKILRYQSISSRALNLEAVHKFIVHRRVMEILHPNTSLFTICFANHCFNQAGKNFHIVILPHKHAQSILNTGGSLCVLVVIYHY